MEQNKELLLSSIKEAMKGELISVSNYKQAAMQATDGDVVKFFSLRMEEEKIHYNYLLKFYRWIQKDEEIPANGIDLKEVENHPAVFTKEFHDRIGQDQILFSAISNAILLEKNAMIYYQQKAEETENLKLKSFYEQMAKWEKNHYDDVLKISKEAEEKFWELNNFAPF